MDGIYSRCSRLARAGKYTEALHLASSKVPEGSEFAQQMARVTCLHRQGYFTKAAELLQSATPSHPFDQIMQTLTASILDVRLCNHPRAAHDRADEAWKRYQSIRDLHIDNDTPILGLATHHELERLYARLMIFGIHECERSSVHLQEALDRLRDAGHSLLLEGAIPESFMALTEYAKLTVRPMEEIEVVVRLADEGGHDIERIRTRLFLAEFLIDMGCPAIDVINQAYELAEQFTHRIGIAEASFLQCKCDPRPFDLRLPRLQELLGKFTALDYVIGVANVHTYASSMAIQCCDFPSTVSIVSASLKFFRSVGFIAGEIVMRQRMAEKYVLLGHPDAAESILSEGFDLTCSRFRVTCATTLSHLTSSLMLKDKCLFWAKQGYDAARLLCDNDDMLVGAVVAYANALYDSDPKEASQLILDQLDTEMRACRYVNVQKLLLLLGHKAFYDEKYLYYYAENMAKIKSGYDIPPQVYLAIRFLELKFRGQLALKLKMENAEKHLEESLSLLPDSNGGSPDLLRLMSPSRYLVQGQLASVLLAKGNIGKALDLYAQAISSAQTSGSFKGMAHLLVSRGHLCLSQFLIWRHLTDSEMNVRQEARTFRDAALADFKLAELLFDQMRLDYVVLPLSQSLVKKRTLNLETRRLYERALELQLAQDNRRELWCWIQASKARSMLDLLGVRSILHNTLDNALGTLDSSAKELLAQETALVTQIHHSTAMDQTFLFPKRLELRNRLTQIRRQMGSNPSLRHTLSMRHGLPADLEMLNESLPPRHVAVEYIVVAGNIYVVVCRKDCQPEVVELRHTYASLLLHVKSSLSDESWLGTMKDIEGLKNFDYLIEPLAEMSEEGEPLIFSPTDEIHRIPLHALRLDGRVLIDRNPVSYTYSLSALLATRSGYAQCEDSRTLVAGYPSGVVFKKAEVGVHTLKTLSTRFQFNSLLGSDATPSKVLSEMSSASVIHLHSHVRFNTDVVDPLSMAVVLLDGQTLTARQLLSSKLKAWLALLVGCESSRAQTGVSDDLMGFVAVLQLAGVKNVIGTLFEIGEEDALQMSVALHEKLHNRGDETIAKILRSVVLEHRQRPGKGAPYYWASFVLHGGDWS